ncbi:MAG: glycosyltransferase family 39 protein, partial [Candidatus Methylacidiphilales bacterium]
FKLSEDKIFTKYPTGVAVLQSPFFFVAHFYSKLTNNKADGFGVPYHKAIDISAIFYLLLGLFFLFKFLKNYFTEKVVLFSVFILLFGTNLYYYATAESGLSHVYSFFLISTFLYYYKKFIAIKSVKLLLLLAILLGFVFIVRQINIFLILPMLFLDYDGIKPFINRFNFDWKAYLLGIVTFLLVVSPQFLYYFYLSNNLAYYSYGDEAFIYKYTPKILKVLFAFENGWITNNPLHLITLSGIAYMLLLRLKNAIPIALLFIVITLTYASWWSTQLGCGLGHRGYVEFYPLFIIPIAYVVQYLLNGNYDWKKYLILMFILICIVVNIKLIYTFDGCWFGKSAWDYVEFSKLLFSPTK